MEPPQGLAALLEESLVVYKGTTDAIGNVGKTTLKCSAIGSASSYPDFDGNQIILTSGSYKGQARDINGATNGDVAGTITVANAFDGQIASGTSFTITGIRTVPAEVAALQADVGDFSAQSNLKSLLSVLGPGWNTDNKNFYVKLITDLLAHGTHGLSVMDDYVRKSICLTGDPASSIGKALYEIYINRLTATRAGYLDELDFDLTARLGSPTGASLAVDIIAIKSEIDNATYGLSALETLVDDIETRLGTPAAGTVAGDVESIETKVGTNADAAGTTTLFARAKQIVDSYLADATIGLAALEGYVDCLPASMGDIVTKDLTHILSDSNAFAGADVGAILLDTGTTLPGEHTTIQNAIAAIQNNTRFTAAVPAYMCKPDAGNTAFKHSANLYDSVGNMEDPANNEILLRIVKNDGTFITANLYKENSLTTALDSATDQVNFPTASGWRAMERDAVGKYFFFYKVANDETEETLTVEFGWDEGGNINFQSRSTEVADVHGDLAAILADVTGINGDAMLTAANVRQSVCLTGDTASSIGKILFDLNVRATEARLAHLNADITSRSSHTAANVRAETCLTGDGADSIGKILFDSNAWWKNGGRLDLILDAIAAEVNADALAQGAGSVVSNVGVDSLVRAIADIARAGGTGDLAAILADVTGINGDAMLTAANVRQSVCLTGDPATSIGKLLFDNLNAPVDSIPTTPTLQATWTNAKAAFLDENISAAKTLTVAERTAIRKSVCLTGDTASSIGKILFDLNARLTAARATNLDELAAANIPADVDKIKTKVKIFAETGTDTQLTIANGVNEITIKTFGKATYGTGEIKAFKVDLDKAVSGFQTLAAAASTIKLRVYEKIDGTNYRLRSDDGAAYTWTQGITTDKVAEIDEISFSEDIQIRAVLSGAPTGTINLPWLCELNKSMEV